MLDTICEVGLKEIPIGVSDDALLAAVLRSLIGGERERRWDGDTPAYRRRNGLSSIACYL